MSEGFPLLTCRKMPFKSMCVEVEGFINGITSKKWYQDRGCKYWDAWANPKIVNNKIQLAKIDLSVFGLKYSEELDKKQVQLETDDLGPLGYAWQWRKFGQVYDYGQSFDDMCVDEDGISDGFDQFQYIIDTLKTNPYDRRMVCSGWNPNQLHLMALPPCHTQFMVNVIGKKLNLMYTMRSVDWILGSNIGMYGLILILLAKESCLEVGELMGVYSDCHIYDNHLEQAQELIKREPLALPTIEFTEWNGIWNWKAEHTVLKDYVSHPSMRFEVTV